MFAGIASRKGASLRRSAYPGHMEKQRGESVQAAEFYLGGSYEARLLDSNGQVVRHKFSSEIRRDFAALAEQVGGRENDHGYVSFPECDRAKLTPEIMFSACIVSMEAAGYDPIRHHFYAEMDYDEKGKPHAHWFVLRRDLDGVLQGQGRFAEPLKEASRAFEIQHGLYRVPEHQFHPHGRRPKPVAELAEEIAKAINELELGASAQALDAHLRERGLWMAASYDDEGKFHGWKAGREGEDGHTASQMGFVGKDIRCPRLNELVPEMGHNDGAEGKAGVLLLGAQATQQIMEQAKDRLLAIPAVMPEPDLKAMAMASHGRGGQRSRDNAEEEQEREREQARNRDRGHRR